MQEQMIARRRVGFKDSRVRGVEADGGPRLWRGRAEERAEVRRELWVAGWWTTEVQKGEVGCVVAVGAGQQLSYLLHAVRQPQQALSAVTGVCRRRLANITLSIQHHPTHPPLGISGGPGSGTPLEVGGLWRPLGTLDAPFAAFGCPGLAPGTSDGPPALGPRAWPHGLEHWIPPKAGTSALSGCGGGPAGRR